VNSCSCSGIMLMEKAQCHSYPLLSGLQLAAWRPSGMCAATGRGPSDQKSSLQMVQQIKSPVHCIMPHLESPEIATLICSALKPL